MQLFQELFENLLLHCKDHQADLQLQSHITVVEALMRVMHEFLILKAKQSDEVDMPIYALVGQHAPSTVSMYYHIDT